MDPAPNYRWWIMTSSPENSVVKPVGRIVCLKDSLAIDLRTPYRLNYSICLKTCGLICVVSDNEHSPQCSEPSTHSGLSSWR